MNEEKRHRPTPPRTIAALQRILALGLVILLLLPFMARAEDEAASPEELLPPVGDRVILWDRDQVPRGLRFSLDDTIATTMAGSYLLGGTFGAVMGSIVLCAALLDDGYRRSPDSHRGLLERGINELAPLSFEAGAGYGRHTLVGGAAAERMEYWVALRYLPSDYRRLEYLRRGQVNELTLRGEIWFGKPYLDLDVRFRDSVSLSPPFESSPRVPLRVSTTVFTFAEYLNSRHRMGLARAEDGRAVIAGQPRPISYSRWRLQSLGFYAERDWYHEDESIYAVDVQMIGFDGRRATDRSQRVSIGLRSDLSFLLGPSDLILPDEDAREIARYTGWFNIQAMAAPSLEVDLDLVKLRLEGEARWIQSSLELQLTEETTISAATSRADLLLRLGATVRASRSLGVQVGVEAGRSNAKLELYELDSNQYRDEMMHHQERSVDRLIGFVRLTQLP